MNKTKETSEDQNLLFSLHTERNEQSNETEQRYIIDLRYMAYFSTGSLIFIYKLYHDV